MGSLEVGKKESWVRLLLGAAQGFVCSWAVKDLEQVPAPQHTSPSPLEQQEGFKGRSICGFGLWLLECFMWVGNCCWRTTLSLVPLLGRAEPRGGSCNQWRAHPHKQIVLLPGFQPPWVKNKLLKQVVFSDVLCKWNRALRRAEVSPGLHLDRGS